MAPSAGGTPTTLNNAGVLEHILNDGEVVIFAIKPSGWFVLLKSAPVLAAVAIVAALLNLLEHWGKLNMNIGALNMACMFFAVARLVIASCQWIGSLYVLTNRRILAIHAAVRVSIDGAMLKDIATTCLNQAAVEKFIGTATLLFENKKGEMEHCRWFHISGGEEIQETVNKAIRKSHG